MSLRTRIALLVGVTVLVASAVGGIGTSVSSRNVGLDRIDTALENDATNFGRERPRRPNQVRFAFDALQAACDEVGEPDADDASADTGRRGGAGRLRFLPDFASDIQLVRRNGTALTACQPLPVDGDDRTIAQAGQGTSFRSVTIDGQRVRILTRGYGDIGAVQFARSLEITEDTLRSLFVRTVIFGLLGAAIASALGWLFAKQATDPVKQLSETAERVALTQDLGERIDVRGDDEIATLATSFNTMLSSLKTSKDQQQRLVQDASHELRTPLTSIQTNIELLQRHQNIDPEMRSEMLADIKSELNELTELTAELVESATEVPSLLSLDTTVDVGDVIEQCVQRGRRRHRRTITVSADATRAVPVLGDFALLSRAVTNLINNAAKFSDGDIEVVLFSQDSTATITVRDRGPGIPVSDTAHIFDRFYRATEARSAPGSGLGLAIVKQIVVGHGGTVSATNRPGGGAEIGFSLPVAPAI